MDELIFARITSDIAVMALVDNVNPVQPEPDSGLSSLYYSLLSVEDDAALSGPTGLAKYQYAFDVLDEDPTIVRATLLALHDRLNGWRGGPVLGCFRESEVSVIEEQGFHGQATYTMWARGYRSYSHAASGSLSLHA